MAYAGNIGAQAAAGRRLAGAHRRHGGRLGGGGPRRCADRLHALACAQGDLARRTLAADHDRRHGLQRAAGRDPLQGSAPARRAGAHRSQLRVALAHAARLAVKPLPTDAPDVSDRLFVTIAASDNTLSPAERLKTIYPRYADAAPIIGTDGLSLQGFRDGSPYQGEDLILEPVRRALPAPLHPPDRFDAGDVPARAADRRCRRDGALSARLAQRLAQRRRRHRSADRGLPPDAGAGLIVETTSRLRDRRRGSATRKCRTGGPSRFRETARRGIPRRYRLPVNRFSSAASRRGFSRCRTWRADMSVSAGTGESSDRC